MGGANHLLLGGVSKIFPSNDVGFPTLNNMMNTGVRTFSLVTEAYFTSEKGL